MTWNDSTRSSSLSDRMSCQKIMHVPNLEGAKRHLWGALVSLWFLGKTRPAVVLYQFSLALGVVIALYKLSQRRRTVITVADIHTKALKRSGPQGARTAIRFAKRWALRSCDGSLVSNAENATFAKKIFGVTPHVLPDPLPRHPIAKEALPHRADVVFVCSYAVDEPLRLILQTCRELAPNYTVAITGDDTRLDRAILGALREAAWVTGYLPSASYWWLLEHARCIVVLSTEAACLPCGAYEAISLGQRPVIVDDDFARGVFGSLARYAKLEQGDLLRVISASVSRPSKLGSPSIEEYERTWERACALIRPLLIEHHRGRARSAETA